MQIEVIKLERYDSSNLVVLHSKIVVVLRASCKQVTQLGYSGLYALKLVDLQERVG